MRAGGRLVLATGVGVRAAARARRGRRGRRCGRSFPLWPGVVTLATRAAACALVGPDRRRGGASSSGPRPRASWRGSSWAAARSCCSPRRDLLENGRLAPGRPPAPAGGARSPPSAPWRSTSGPTAWRQEGSLARLLFGWGFGPRPRDRGARVRTRPVALRARGSARRRRTASRRAPRRSTSSSSLAQLYDRALSRRGRGGARPRGVPARRRRCARACAGPRSTHARASSLGTALAPLRAIGEIPTAELQLRLRSLNDAYRRLSSMLTLAEVHRRFRSAARAARHGRPGPGRGEGAGADVPAGGRPRAARGRARDRQDAAGARRSRGSLGCRFRRIQFTPDLMPADLARHQRLQPEDAAVRVPAGPDLRRPAAGRRGEPHAAAHAVGAARVHAGGRGHRRRHALPHLAGLHRARDAEPRRVRGHLPAARGAARPLPDEDHDRLPDAPRTRARIAGGLRGRAGGCTTRRWPRWSRC